ALNIVSLVKLHGQAADLIGRKSGAQNIAGAAVYTIFAVIDTLIRKQDLQQGDTPAVSGKAVADSRRRGIPDKALFPAAVYAAGGAGNVIFGRVRKNLQFFL